MEYGWNFLESSSSSTLALLTASPLMMSAWAVSDPIRHPWFSHSSLKRKHSDSSDEDNGRNSDSDQETSPSFYPTPPPESAGYIDSDGDYVERKRRRCDTIERRMARMYIDGRNTDPSQVNAGYPQNKPWAAPSLSTSLSAASDASYAYTAGSTSPVAQSALLPQYAVEEPASPEFRSDVQLEPSSSSEHLHEPTIMEVRMKSAEPAWYERQKDRIVITDLDEALQEAEEEEYKSEAEPHPDASEHADSNADYSISSILLDHIKRQANFPYAPRTGGEESSGALVLFRAPPLPAFSSPSPSDNAVQREGGDDEVRVEEIDEREARAFTPSGDFTVGSVSMDQEDEMAGEPMDMDMDVEM
ncbi:hypothetical protein ACEPAF_7930 [Sanghuangporus sanghuang]